MKIFECEIIQSVLLREKVSANFHVKFKARWHRRDGGGFMHDWSWNFILEEMRRRIVSDIERLDVTLLSSTSIEVYFFGSEYAREKDVDSALRCFVIVMRKLGDRIRDFIRSKRRCIRNEMSWWWFTIRVVNPWLSWHGAVKLSTARISLFY